MRRIVPAIAVNYLREGRGFAEDRLRGYGVRVPALAGFVARGVEVAGRHGEQMQKLELAQSRRARSVGLTRGTLEVVGERLRVGEHHARKTEGPAPFFPSTWETWGASGAARPSVLHSTDGRHGSPPGTKDRDSAVRGPGRFHSASGRARSGGRRGNPSALPREAAHGARAPRWHG